MAAPGEIDPYASPAAETTDRTTAGPGGVGRALPWSPIDAITYGWELVRKQPIAVLVVFVAQLIANVPGVIGGAIGGVMRMRDPTNFDLFVQTTVVQYAIVLVGMPLTIWAGMGQRRYLLKLVRGQPAEFVDIFKGGPLLSGIGAFALVFLAIATGTALFIGVPLLALGTESPYLPAVAGAGGLVLVVVWPYLVLSIQFFEALIVDGRAGAWTSLTMSWTLTRGHLLALLGFALLWAGLVLAAFLLGLLACCIGVIVTFPVAMTMLHIAHNYVYLRLAGERPAPAA